MRTDTRARPQLYQPGKSDARASFREYLILGARLNRNHLAVIQADGSQRPSIRPILANLAEVSIVIGNGDARGGLPERGHQVAFGRPDFDARDILDRWH